MIPGLINLVIGGTALVRAAPGLPQVMLRFLPAAGGVPAYDRAWIAAVLTLQAALGAILGVAVQAAVAWGLLFYAMPAVGLGLRDLARGLAALDLPARVIASFTSSQVGRMISLRSTHSAGPLWPQGRRNRVTSVADGLCRSP
jgi:hypothetical protein